MKAEALACIIIASVTLLIRALPFILESLFHKSSNSPFLDTLSEKLTPALIGMLVVFCFKDISFANSTGPAALIAGALCIASYALKRNTLISIVLPTVLYMVLLRIM